MKWEKVRLGDVTDSCLGKMLDKEKNKGDYQPYLANVNVRWGEFNFDELPEMRFEAHEQERYGLEYGDLIVCEGGEPGRCAIWKNQIPNMKIQKALHRVRTHDCLDYCFLFYWFLLAGRQGVFEQYITGATIKHLPGDKLKSILIDLPPLSYQKRVAEILSAYDNLIENNQKQIKFLEEAAQRLYKEWFVDLRFPGHETTPIVDGMPKGWIKDRADLFFDITIGKTPPRAESQWFVNNKNGIQWVSISDMGKSGAYIFETVEGLTTEAVEKYNVKIIPADTVLVSFKLTVGRVSITTENMCTNEAIAHFRVDKELRDYTYLYLKSFEYDNLGNTSAISKAVNSKIIKAMPFIMPDKSTLINFERLIAPIMNEIYNKSLQIKQLTEARDRLLPKLMSGEIEV